MGLVISVFTAFFGIRLMIEFRFFLLRGWRMEGIERYMRRNESWVEDCRVTAVY